MTKTFFQFDKTESSLCSFCHIEAETKLHVFHKCSITKIIWNQFLPFFETHLDVPDLTLQAAVFGFINESDNNSNILQILILLILKLYICQSSIYLSIKNVTKEKLYFYQSLIYLSIENFTEDRTLGKKTASVCEKKTI